MGRKRIKPQYDPDKLQAELIGICSDLYMGKTEADDNAKSPKNSKSLRYIANELDISVSKVIKLLITGGIYKSVVSEKVSELYAAGKDISEIQAELGVSRATVHSYLPYKKGVYSAKETSVNADRIRVYRERCKCLDVLLKDMTEDALWQAVVAFQVYPFYTASGLPFSYVLKEGRDGTLNKELVVSRREESKTLSWSSVTLAFHKALEMQGEVIVRPKALGDIRGISYVYPMLYRFGIIEVPLLTAGKMRLKGGARKRE